MMKYLSRPEELVLVTLWKMKEEKYGVNIRRYISDLTGKYWSIGSVYVPLDRLERKGFVKSYLGNATAERGGKAKRIYEITEEGREELLAIQKVYESFWTDIPNLNR